MTLPIKIGTSSLKPTCLAVSKFTHVRSEFVLLPASTYGICREDKKMDGTSYTSYRTTYLISLKFENSN